MRNKQNVPVIPGEDQQAEINREYTYRNLILRMDDASGQPVSLDESNRSVEMVGATEAPTMVFDWERYEMWPEVLRMDGCELPAVRQVILLDTHSRWSTSSVIGSYRNMQISGDQLTGRAHFSAAKEGEGPYQKIREGHITDCSVGYRVLEMTRIEKGKTETINGRSYTGPMRVVTRWEPKELSICPIGADVYAKVRAATSSPDNPNIAEVPINRGQVKESKMDPKVRAYLESRGLSKTATEEEAVRFKQDLETRGDYHPPVEHPASSTTANPAALSNDAALRADRERQHEIRQMCRHFEIEDAEADRMCNDGTTVDAARKFIMDKRMAAQPATPGFVPSVSLVVDGRDKFRAAARDAMLIRAGFSVENPAVGYDELRGYTLKENARECLRQANQRIGGDDREMVGRALTTSDLPNLLNSVANRALLEGWESEPETWSIWCGTLSVPDFRKQTLVRASEIDDLDEIKEDGKYNYGYMKEGKEEVKIATYGKIYPINRQAIINDDLGAITGNYRAHGEASARLVGDLPYAVLVANAAMGDNVDLFHATHANIGTSGLVGNTTLKEFRLLMRSQKDIKNLRRLSIRMQYFIAPVTLEGDAEEFFNAQYLDFALGKKNPWFGPIITRVYEGRLDDADTARYYGAARKGKTISLAFLNGNQTPYIETQPGWRVDGIENKVRIDAAAVAVDYRGLVTNEGVAAE